MTYDEMSTQPKMGGPVFLKFWSCFCQSWAFELGAKTWLLTQRSKNSFMPI